MLDQVMAKGMVAVPLTAISVIFVVILLLVVVSQHGTGRFDITTRLQHDGSVLDKQESVCPGPVLEPSERQEPWNKKFSRQLNEEVASQDADKVRRPFLGTSKFSRLYFPKTIPASGL